MLEDPDFSTDGERIKNRDRLCRELNSRLGAMKEAEILRLAEKAVIPFAPISRPSQLFQDPHLNQAGRLVDTRLPGGKTARLPKIPLAMGDHPLGLYRNPPKVGEGGREVLMRCGFSAEEVELLVREGVLIEKTQE